MDVEMLLPCRFGSKHLGCRAEERMLMPITQLSAVCLCLTVKTRQQGLRGHHSGSGLVCLLVSIAME